MKVGAGAGAAGLHGRPRRPRSRPTPRRRPSTATASRGAPIDTGGFRYQRPIPEGPAQLVVLPLDAAALAHSQGPPRHFADVRIVDEQNLQVPYVLEPRRRA